MYTKNPIKTLQKNLFKHIYETNMKEKDTHTNKPKLHKWKPNQNYKHINKIHIESTFKRPNALTYPKTYKHATAKINKPNHTHMHTSKEKHNKTNTTRSQLTKTQNPNTNNKLIKDLSKHPHIYTKYPIPLTYRNKQHLNLPTQTKSTQYFSFNTSPNTQRAYQNNYKIHTKTIIDSRTIKIQRTKPLVTRHKLIEQNKNTPNPISTCMYEVSINTSIIKHRACQHPNPLTQTKDTQYFPNISTNKLRASQNKNSDHIAKPTTIITQTPNAITNSKHTSISKNISHTHPQMLSINAKDISRIKLKQHTTTNCPKHTKISQQTSKICIKKNKISFTQHIV